MPRPVRPLVCALCSTLFVSATALAQVSPSPVAPKIGSSDPVSAEPPVARPTTRPCTVPLLTEQAFANFDNKPITYNPPADCPGPWAKVVFSADFTVSAGRQYDRTAQVFLGGANIYFGTTAEPRRQLAPSWHVERDVTDLSALFHAPEVGQAILGNFVGVSNGVTYNGIIYANMRLQFYPANTANPAPTVPDEVLGFPTNNTTFVNTTTDQAAGTFTFPRNLESLYLDVISQSQASDEFWYTCVPSNVAGELENCGNTAFRETEVAIDGKPAGIAPVYPWIYTGGIDPYLWEPITGLETLNLKPYRVDLTPFAGLLADGQQHTVAVSVFNANSGFDIASTLLLYTDHGAATTSGAVTTDTLTAPHPVVTESLNTAADGTVSGPVSVLSSRTYTVAGYVNTSHGRVSTTIQGNSTFSNIQDEKVSSNEFKQDLVQNTGQQELTTTISNTGTIQTQHDSSYPFVANIDYVINPDGTSYQTAYVKQQKITQLRSPIGPNSPNPIVTSETVESSDTINISAAGSITGSNAHSDSLFGSKDQYGRCIARSLASVDLKLTQYTDSTSCSLAP